MAMKSIRYAAKNVQEMSRELAAISAVTIVTTDLTEKLHSAEQMKAETEARLNERVRPLYNCMQPGPGSFPSTCKNGSSISIFLGKN